MIIISLLNNNYCLRKELTHCCQTKADFNKNKISDLEAHKNVFRLLLFMESSPFINKKCALINTLLTLCAYLVHTLCMFLSAFNAQSKLFLFAGCFTRVPDSFKLVY